MGIALGLAFWISGCGGKPADPSPGASESPAAAPIALSSPAAVAQDVAAAPPPPSAAAQPPSAASVVPVRIRALGTEPFWSARISGEMLTYTTPEDPQGQRAALTRRDHAKGADFSGRLGAATIRLEVTKCACSDGMSDRSYPFAVVLTLGSDRRDGCAV